MLTLEKLPAGQSPTAETPRWQKMLNPDGTWSVLKLQNTPPSSDAKSGPALTLPTGTVRWAAILPPELARQAAGGVQLVGNLQSNPPVVEECSPLRQQAPLLPAPPGVNLVRHLEWTTFGVEERVQEKDTTPDTPSWTMKPGARPAGVYAARPWRMPSLGSKAPWGLQIVARGSGKIRTGLAFDNGHGFGDAAILETLDLKNSTTAHTLKLPKALAEAKQLRVVLLAPDDHAAELEVSSISFQQGTESKASNAATDAELGVWNWSTKPDEWRRLAPLWKQAGVRVLQLALPRELKDGPLQSLSELRRDGFHIVAVEGDPHMILPQEKSNVVARHQQLASLHGKYLDGIQYDVEPYLLPGFLLEPELWHQHWLQMYEAITPGKAPLKVEPVVPFWLIAQPAAQKLLKGLAPRAARIVVMNYRSDAGDAAAWATSWLEWSVQHQCPVGLAVECGPVPDLQSATFRKAERGTLWIQSWPGHGTVAVLFEGEVEPGAATGATTFALARQGTVSGAATSLQGQDPAHVAEWLQTMRGISQRLNVPAKLTPRLLLHEPKEELLRYLGERKEKP